MACVTRRYLSSQHLPSFGRRNINVCTNDRSTELILSPRSRFPAAHPVSARVTDANPDARPGEVYNTGASRPRAGLEGSSCWRSELVIISGDERRAAGGVLKGPGRVIRPPDGGDAGRFGWNARAGSRGARGERVRVGGVRAGARGTFTWGVCAARRVRTWAEEGAGDAGGRKLAGGKSRVTAEGRGLG